MSLVVIDRSCEAGSPWTARLSLYQISISAGSQATIHTQQHTLLSHMQPKDTRHRIASRNMAEEEGCVQSLGQVENVYSPQSLYVQ